MIHAPLAFLLIAQPVLKPDRPASPPDPAAQAVFNDEQILKNVFLDASGPALLTFFRQRMTLSVESKHLAKLTAQLSDERETVHAKAAAELVGLGPLALPALRQTINQADTEETLDRARRCLQAIEGSRGSTVAQSAVRVLAVRRPQGAAETLLKYLPFADDESVVQEIEAALLALGLRDGKPAPALMRALRDAEPVRRGLAARVLCQIGGAAGCNLVHPLLKDAKPSVRMQAALSLTEAHNAEGVPVLIDLVAELPPEGRQRVEEYLRELAGDWAVRTPQSGDALSARLRRQLWSAWWRTLDGKKLLDEFTHRTLTNEERTRALAWITQLNDASAEVRAKACEELIGMGPRTASLLRRILDQHNAAGAAEGGGDTQAIELAQQCLASLEGDAAKPLPQSAPRLLALRRPVGAVEALLAYLPFAENETLAEQITEMLVWVGCPEGQADPALVRALEDKVGVRRAAAVVALCKGKADMYLPAIRKRLGDADATVRLRTAMVLARRGDKKAVPVLIDLLADLPLDQVWEPEHMLTTLAGDTAPSERVQDDKKSRTAAVNAWKAWWRKEENNVDLAKLRDPERGSGLLLVIDMQGGRILEITRNGRVRWQLSGPQWPWDAVVCRNGNVFVVSQHTDQVAMWSRQGKHLWTRTVSNPFACQQLRNGNLFVVCRQNIAEFDVNGKPVSSKQLGHLGYIVGGGKFANGHVALFTQQGQYLRLDAAGKQVKTYQVTMRGAASAEVLPGDRVVASLNMGRVAEYDNKGKTVWETSIVRPAVPHRLPNGHTLVGQNNSNHLYELDRKGKIVSEKKDLEYRPWRIRRR